jgi:hypothetical protein
MKIKFYFSSGRILLKMMLLFYSVASFAQTKTVTGKVTAQDDNTLLPGVNVIVKGTTTGSVTDANGSYSVTVPGDDATLVFTFIGYAAEEVVVGNRSSIDIKMVSDIKSLQEVVVTGYTTQSRRDITGAVSVVKPQELLATPAGNVQQQLQGRVAGVVTSGTGVPGAGAKVRYGVLGLSGIMIHCTL